MLQRALHIVFLGAAFLALTACPSGAATYDWGTTGVSDTAVVDNIEQLTDNVLNDGVVSGDYPTSSGFAPHPWNGAGDWIVYTANITDNSTVNREIFVSKPDGTGMARLTTNAVEDSNASFGSDGKIYFERYVGPNYNDYQIFRMESDGSLQTNLTSAHSGTQSERNVALSPNGSKIAFYSANALWVADADGTSPEKVSAAGYNVYDYYGFYSWSPDSNQIAYTCYDIEGIDINTWQICLVNKDGTHSVLTSGSGYKTWPSWSPDGSRIAFLQEEYPSYKVMTVKADGSGDTTVDEAIAGGGSWQYIHGPLSWSPDGRWLAYAKSWTDSTYALHMTKVDTLQTHQLTQGYSDFAPFWSPTGSQILFSDSRYYASRDDSDAVGVGTNNGGDLLLINLIGEYGATKAFPWPMFLPAIQEGGKK
ncbi:MAG: hypothetical protein ACOY3O_14860 [Thermodesulfobacteriota bacterium]